MVIVNNTESESEWEKVEKTNTVSYIRCDVCSHDYEKDEWNGEKFAVNPGISREANTIYDLQMYFNAYHTSIETHVIDDGYDGVEMNFDAPQRPFTKVLQKEAEIASQTETRPAAKGVAVNELKREYAGKIGVDGGKFYLVDGKVHHFRYVLDIEASTDDHKHVCNDCYDVLFE